MYMRHILAVHLWSAAENTETELPAVCDQCVMEGSAPLPFVASFVPCPVFAIGYCVGLITVPRAGLPIPLGTNL